MAANPLTDIKIRTAKGEAGKRVEIWDAQIPGFGLRITSTGTKSFVLLYRIHGKARRMTLGRYPTLGLADARIKAREALNTIDTGNDPQADAGAPFQPGAAQRSQVKAKLGYQLANVVEDFVQRHCKRNNRASTARETERILKARLVEIWPTRDVREITKHDILALLDKIVDAGTPSAANHALAAIRKFFNWCIERGLIDTSPCMGVRMPSKAVSRSRTLDDGELAAVLKAADKTGYSFGTIVRLLVMTGQRRSEVGGMRWQDVDVTNAVWTIPAEANKSGREHIVPLTASALRLIETLPHLSETYLFPSQRSPDRCFSGYSKCKARLDNDSSVSDWTLHDLRRTVATGLASLQVPPHVVEKLLNHSSGTFSGVAGVYNRFAYQNEIRGALTEWEEYLAGLTA